jgi:hypothetical protein
MLSAVRTVRVLNSYARWARIRLISSVVASTFDRSRYPWRRNPVPFNPGVAMSGWPDDAISANRFRPSAVSPAAFWNRTRVIWPTGEVAFVAPAFTTDTVPSAAICTLTASCGMVTCG